jgi:hypothetical protein
MAADALASQEETRQDRKAAYGRFFFGDFGAVTRKAGTVWVRRAEHLTTTRLSSL